jgi:site-specific DNA recombinase
VRVLACAYIRCSTAEQAIDGMSLDAQRSRISSWCEATGTELAEIITDAGISGTRPLADRPGGARIASLLTARNPDVDTVVIARLDRLGRNAAESLGYLRQFTVGKVSLVSVTDRLDLSSATGRAMAQMSAVFAELERALIAQRTSEALRELRSQGRPYGSVAYGWNREGDRLVECEIEQCVLARIRRMRGRRLSYARIASKLNSDGIAAKRGGPWHSMSVRSTLKTSSQIGRIDTEVAA